jgi:hypothetical protein
MPYLRTILEMIVSPVLYNVGGYYGLVTIQCLLTFACEYDTGHIC